jgi:uncharacterized protein YggU (UPF0235/DUF167 family)
VPPWRPAGAAVELAVRAKPRAGRNGIDGVAVEGDGSAWLVVRVTAVAEDGKANRAVIAELARALDIAPSSIELQAGQSSRRKRLRIAGEPERLVAALEKLAPEPG